MSAWAVFSMMGFYPDCPGNPSYTLTAPRFDKVEIRLNPEYCGGKESLVITKTGTAGEGEWLKITGMTLGGKKHSSYRVSHDALTRGGHLAFTCRPTPQNTTH
jgi:putative alpha-1,2-mannosidase